MSAEIFKKYPLLIALILLFPLFSNAQVSINEVLYAPQSKSWVEVYNNTDSDIDLTKYKILDSGAAVNGHAISAVSSGNMLASHAFGVVAKDPTVFGASTFPMFKAALAAKTSGDTISLKNDSGNITDTFSFLNTLGAAGDGNSLQKTDSGWIASTPTPGALNSTMPTSPVNQSSGTSGESDASTTSDTDTQTTTGGVVGNSVTTILSTHYSYLPLSEFNASQALAVSAGRDRIATVGNPIEFVADANIDDGTVAYTWNFGDGTTGGGKKMLHIYSYPGDYVVVLNAASASAKAVSRAQVTVTEPQFKITNADAASISVTNASAKEANLYGWKLAAAGKTFEFPQDTIILSNATVAFASSITGLYPGNAMNVSIIEDVPSASSTVPVKGMDVAERDVLYRELVALQKSANALASAGSQHSASSRSASTTGQNMRMNSNTAQVAVPVIAVDVLSTSTATSAETHGWFKTLEHFFGLK